MRTKVQATSKQTRWALAKAGNKWGGGVGGGRVGGGGVGGGLGNR